jgi:hypothetical protein
VTRGEKTKLTRSGSGSAPEKAKALREILGPDYEVHVLDDSTVEISSRSKRLCTVAFGRRAETGDGKAVRSADRS